MITLPQLIQFQWDKGNINKNWLKHRVSNEECEETFFDPNKKILKDFLHSGREPRYIILGKTRGNRLLFLVFIIRNKKVRVISARDLNKRESKFYGEQSNTQE